MEFERVVGLVGLAIGMVPYGAFLLRWIAKRRPARTFLGLHHDQPVEVIVSTNTVRAAGPGEAKTYTTALGELRAVAVGARTVLPLYKQKKMSVFMSAEYPGRLQADTLILGGPLRNTYAGRLIDYVNRQYPSARLHLDALANEIGVGGDPIRFDQRRENGIPREDLALLVLATVSNQESHDQRFVLCAGLSTYGTEGAARLLFQRVIASSTDAVRMRRLLTGPAAAAIVHVHVAGQQVIRTELLEQYCWTAPATRRPSSTRTVSTPAR
jgi:hypothetical protein